VCKTQNEDKFPFFITITYRQYRDTGNIVYKTQNEDKHPFFITITYSQYRDTGNIVYKTQNEDKYPFIHYNHLLTIQRHRQHCVQDTERRQASILHYNHL